MGSALVLAGGGVTGVAWETGVLLGLRDEGVDLTSAELIVGTSAGSVVGAQVRTGPDLAELYERQLAEAPGELKPSLDMASLAGVFADVLSETGSIDLVKIGRVALEADTVDEATRRAVIESRLSTEVWPDRRLVVTAVDAATGEFVTFDGIDGISLIDAVGASCAVPAVWPPVTINGRRYMDGGVRSTANADLAAGSDPIVVLAPLRGLGAATFDLEIAGLEASGATVVVLAADEAATEAMGPDALDPAMRRPSAETGRRQGRLEAARVAAVWNA